MSTIALGSPTRNKENTAEICTAHTDLDFRSIAEDEPAIRQIADTLSKPPSSIVFSGGGLHLYWFLKEPLNAQLYRERIEALNRKIAIMLAGDGAAVDVCRLMRLPGTTNSKYNDQRRAVVEKLDAAQRYDLEELEEWVAEARPLLTVRAEQAEQAEQVEQVNKSNKSNTTAKHSRNIPLNPYLAVAEEQGWKPPLDVEQMLADMAYPGNIHDTQIRASASLLKAGNDPEEVVAAVLAATMGADGVDFEKWDWRAEERGIREACDSAIKKFDIPSPGNSSVNAREMRGISAEDVPPSSISRETPQSTDEMAGKGAPIGVSRGVPGHAQSENVISFAQNRAKSRKTAPKADLQAAFVVVDGLVKALRQQGQDIMLAEGDVWVYRKGFWSVITSADEQLLKTMIQQGFEEIGSSAKGSTLSLAWKRLTEHPGLYKADVPWAGGNVIVCRNGAIRQDADSPDGWSFEGHRAENYARRHIGADYDPSVECPRFITLLKSMFSDRPDANLVIPLLQEWLGSALAISSLRREQRRALIPVGVSRTGKTELTSIIRALLGGPIATPSAKEFGERFGLETMYGAVAWVRDDAINEGDKLDPQRFKTVVTGEAIDIDRKNKPAIRDVRLDIPVVLTANSLARVRDSSDAVFNRSLILTMSNVIDDQTAQACRVEAGAGDQSIGMTVFEAEASGILNWALEGLCRLRKRGFYNIPESIKMSITQYKDDNNPVGQWAREALKPDPYSKVERRDLVRSYNGWELEQEGDEARAHGGRWLLPKLRNQVKGLSEMQTHSGHRYLTGVKLTALGIATWTSYGDASPRNGPGGFATSPSEVNQLYKQPG